MPTLHRDMTGAELHEPKGIETAPVNSVYVSNGSGSGTWLDKNAGNLSLNRYWLCQKMTDVSAPNNRVFFAVPAKSEIQTLTAILDNSITTADSVLQIYINGVLFADSLTVSFAGSTAGVPFTKQIVTAHSIEAGSVVEIRSNGASDTVAAAYIQLGLRAKV